MTPTCPHHTFTEPKLANAHLPVYGGYVGPQPKLPDSDDPSEILSVPEWPTLAEVTRAYFTLIGVYRPRESPHEYQRIVAAYEYWRETLRNLDGEESNQWQSVSPAGAQRPLSVSWQPLPDLTEPCREGFRERVQNGASAKELAEWWLKGLSEELELVEPIFSLSRPEVLQELAQSEELSWPKLGARRIRSRGRLWQLYATRKLERGEWQDPLEQIRSLSFRLAAPADQALVDAAWASLSVAAWEVPFETIEELRWLAPLRAKAPGLDAVPKIASLSVLVRPFLQAPGVSETFSALLRRGRVSHALRRKLLSKIGNSWSRDALDWWSLCERLGYGAPDVARYLLQTLRLEPLGQEAGMASLPAVKQRELVTALERATQAGAFPASNPAGGLGVLAGGGAAVALLGALLLTPIALAESVEWGRVFRWLWSCCVLLVAWKLLAAFVQRKKLGKVVTELRRALPPLGLGYQQLLAARAFAKRPPAGLEHRLDLELYLTLALAASRARAQDSG